MKRGLLAWILGGALSGATWPGVGSAFANVEPGQRLENAEMPTLDGGRALFLSPGTVANVFVFFRPDQDHSLETLRALTECAREFEKKPVRWVAVVSDSWPREDVKATVLAAGAGMPVLIDEAERLYGKLGVRLHPVVGIADGNLVLLDYVPFHKVNYCDMIRVRVRKALGEADQAAVDRVDRPPKALMPNEMPAAQAKRHLRLGESLLKKRQWQKAEAEARVALEKAPDLAPAQLLLGDALAGQGRCPEAGKVYGEAVRLDPALAAAAGAAAKACGRK